KRHHFILLSFSCGYFIAYVYTHAVQLHQVAYRSVVASAWSSQSVRIISSAWKTCHRSGGTGYATADSSSELASCNRAALCATSITMFHLSSHSSKRLPSVTSALAYDASPLERTPCL